MFDAKEFYDKVNNICIQRGLTVTKLLKILNLSTSFGTYWKNGRIPGVDTVKEIADYFDISTDYLLGRTSNPISHKKADTISRDLIRELDQLAAKTHEIQNLIGGLLENDKNSSTDTK